ncbi:MAG: S41 family peptidase, partial [Bacteroidota bacterium]
ERAYNNPEENPKVERSWIEYVSPREITYDKPLVVLAGRWTGSMGEGMTVGLDGMGRAEVVGSEMERLAGEMNGFSFKNQSFGYRLSTAKLFHINGTPREKYVPKHYVEQSTTQSDEVLEKGIELINKMTAVKAGGR